MTGEEPAEGNKYNQNFRNKFCGCGEEYDSDQEKGTMFQCLGLGTVEEGGCGEDWWHPECVLGLSREDFKKSIEKQKANDGEGAKDNGIKMEISVTRYEEEGGRDPEARRPSVVTAIAAGLPIPAGIDGNDAAAEAGEEEEDDDTPLPPGFPAEDDFEYFLCYKCVNAFPWIKQYASAPGFLPPVYCDATVNQAKAHEAAASTNGTSNGVTKKRKADDDSEADNLLSPTSMAPPKRQKSEDPTTTLSSIPEDTPTTTTLPLTLKNPDTTSTAPQCKLTSLPPLSEQSTKTPFSLFMSPDFHTHLCRCPEHFPLLKPHPQLLEEEDVYEPPISEDGDNGAGSVGTGSLLDRGEAAFSNMDRARAIQGAMAFAHLKDGLKAFLKPYADEGKAVGAEDINVFFQKLRGDDQAIQEAGAGARLNQDGEGGGDGDDNRREQSGY